MRWRGNRHSRNVEDITAMHNIIYSKTKEHYRQSKLKQRINYHYLSVLLLLFPSPKGIEVYKNKPIIYGCGDFLNDYEGILGQESYRGDLGFMYFLTINAKTGDLISMQLVPTQIKQFRIQYADKADSLWLQQMLNREGQKLGWPA